MTATVVPVSALTSNAATVTITGTAGPLQLPFNGFSSFITGATTGAGTFNVGSPSDSANGAYIRDMQVSGSVTGRACLGIMPLVTSNIINGSTTFSLATGSTSSKQNAGFYVLGGRVGSLDTNPASKSATGTAVSVNATGTLKQANELAFLLVLWDGAATISAAPVGWTNCFGPATTFNSTPTTVVNWTLYYQQTSATTTLSPTMTLSASVNWSAQVTTYTWTDNNFGAQTKVVIPNNKVGPMALRQITKNIQYSSTTPVSSGSIFNQSLSATVTSLAAFQNIVSKGLSATATSTVSMLKVVNKNVGATATSTASFIKVVSKSLAATATSTALVVAAAIRLVVLSAGVSSLASIKKTINKSVSANTTSSASIIKTVNKNLSATVTSTASVVKTVNKKLSAGVSSIASLVATFVAGGGPIVHNLVMSAGVTVVGKFKMLVPFGSGGGPHKISLLIDSFNIFKR